MKKSILKKLLIGSLIVVIITFFTTGAFVFGLVVKSALNNKIAMLKSNTERITELSYVALYSEHPTIVSMYRATIDSVYENTGASVIVFDIDGSVITVAGLEKQDYIGKTLKDVYTKDVLAGKSISRTGIFDSLYGETVLTVASPMKNGDVIFGGVILNLPMPELNKVYISVFQNLIITMIVAMLASGVLFYFISRKITDPINEISHATTEFSKGNFEKRVNYKSNDEIGELADNFNSMAESLQSLEEMRSNFISNVSHELRTPMTSISGFIEGILDGTIDKENERKYLAIVLSETKRLSRLVTSLLDISHLENGKYQINKMIFNINELARHILIKFENVITEKKIDVNLTLLNDKCDVYADSDAITQVITNLLHNAVKFTPEEGFINIYITERDTKVYFEIENSGHGIESDKLKYIWDRFYKTDSSRSEDTEGLGLGLYIVKSILNAHDEKIWVKSDVDKSTKFAFSLSKPR